MYIKPQLTVHVEGEYVLAMSEAHILLNICLDGSGTDCRSTFTTHLVMCDSNVSEKLLRK